VIEKTVRNPSVQPAQVVDLRWPAEADQRERLAHEGRPRLLVVDHGEAPPPCWDGLEDWVRPDADAIERYVRRERLRRRAGALAPASIDDDGLLHRGDRWVALPPGELAALTALMSEPGYMVARDDLALAIGMPADETDSRSRTLDNVVRRVRKRIAPLGMAVCVVRGAGFLLEMGELPVV
jgi:hypothetical protein